MIAIYARQSIEKKDSVSIEAQIEKCKYYCDSQDYKIYKDAGYSGKNINRPQFSKLLEDIKSGLVTKVIAYRLDRISRSIADFSQLLIMFDEYNVDFISATENFDTNTLFHNFVNFNINYTNNGNTEIVPNQANLNAKATIAGAALTT